MRTKILSLTLLLLLGACEKDLVKDDGASLAEGTEKAEILDEIPQAFRGRWTLGDGTCRAEQSEGYLDVTARELAYWESSGIPKLIQQVEPNIILLNIDMSGEGDVWSSLSAFHVTHHGTRMTRQDADFDQLVHYRKCQKQE